MRPLTVAEMMTTSVKTIHEDELISSADWDMVVGDLRHLPVVDLDRRLVGLVSDRDLMRATAQKSSVASVMTRDVRTIGPDTPAAEAIELLLHHKHSALPVVDAHRRLVGIVTSTDFLELARRALSGFDANRPHVRA